MNLTIDNLAAGEEVHEAVVEVIVSGIVEGNGPLADTVWFAVHDGGQDGCVGCQFRAQGQRVVPSTGVIRTGLCACMDNMPCGSLGPNLIKLAGTLLEQPHQGTATACKRQQCWWEGAAASHQRPQLGPQNSKQWKQLCTKPSPSAGRGICRTLRSSCSVDWRWISLWAVLRGSVAFSTSGSDTSDGWARWLMPVISAFWEAKAGGSRGQEFETSMKPVCTKNTKISWHLGRLKWVDHLRSGVQGQPGQHGETPSPNNTKACWAWWCTPIIPATQERLRQKNHLNPGGGGCNSPSIPGMSQPLPLREKACLALGSPMLLPRPTLTGAGRIALIGLAAASNEGLPRALPLSSGALGPESDLRLHTTFDDWCLSDCCTTIPRSFLNQNMGIGDDHFLPLTLLTYFSGRSYVQELAYSFRILQSFGKLRQEDHLSPGVQDQFGKYALAENKLVRKPKAFKDTGKTPMELEVAIHQIQIALTSCNIKSLEKMYADLIRGVKEKNLSERTSLNAYQDFENHYKKNSLWLEYSDTIVGHCILQLLGPCNPPSSAPCSWDYRDSDYINQKGQATAESNYKSIIEISGKFPNIWKVNNTLPARCSGSALIPALQETEVGRLPEVGVQDQPDQHGEPISTKNTKLAGGVSSSSTPASSSEATGLFTPTYGCGSSWSSWASRWAQVFELTTLTTVPSERPEWS
ncbi:40S ribosomal protein S20 [Plecturocebus cupreus]